MEVRLSQSGRLTSGNQIGKDEARGVPFDVARGRLLHCALHDEAVKRFGRDDDFFWWKRTADPYGMTIKDKQRQRQKQKQNAGPSTVAFAKCANAIAQDDSVRLMGDLMGGPDGLI